MKLFLCTFFFYVINTLMFWPQHLLVSNFKKHLHISKPQADTTSLKVLPFPFGAAVKVNLLKSKSSYRNLIIKQFRSITAENAMKFKILHPSKDVYKWDDADYIVNFAQKNGIRVHGHTLLWPRVNPKWVSNFSGDSVAWEGLLKSHIQTVVKHFKGKVLSWDVVNEAFNDNGTYKSNIWLTKLGNGYIARSFKYAREADPNALLFYNDYGQEYSGAKLKAIVKMVKNFQENDIPIDGLGLQMHTVLRITDKAVKNAISVSAATGLKIHLSELEVSVNYKKGASFQFDTLLANKQAKKYKQIINAFVSIPPQQQFGVTTWNVADADSWKNAKIKGHDYPLLFDYNYNAKPALKAILSITSGPHHQ